MTNETSTKQWFVVHTYSGFENKVAAAIEQRAKIFGLQDQVTRVVVPVEEVVEVRRLDAAPPLVVLLGIRPQVGEHRAIREDDGSTR